MLDEETRTAKVTDKTARQELANQPGRISSFRRSVISTTATNVISTVAAGLTGILIARSLGASDRGIYAAVMAWFGLLLVIGEMGQTAATTFYVARDRKRARDYVATSRRLMTATGLVSLILGILCAPLLADGSVTAESGYRLMFATCLFSYVGASLTYSLQALHTSTWNLIRVFQPLAFGAGVWALYLLDSMTVLTCLLVTSTTLCMQAALAYLSCRRKGLAGGRARRGLAKRMATYGMAHLASAAPAVIASRLDVLALSIFVDSSSLGHYAVAVSVTGLALPLVAGIGAVVFPRLALQHDGNADASRNLVRRALTSAAIISACSAVVLVVSTPWLVPAVFGLQFQSSIPLVFILAPGAAALATSQVCGDVLRGHGSPLSVARVQWAAAIVTVVATAILLPTCGVIGAAIASTISAFAGLVFSLLTLRRRRRSRSASGHTTPLAVPPKRQDTRRESECASES
jgi:O-antigen/teichoic acid export membrane protein